MSARRRTGAKLTLLLLLIKATKVIADPIPENGRGMINWSPARRTEAPYVLGGSFPEKGRVDINEGQTRRTEAPYVPARPFPKNGRVIINWDEARRTEAPYVLGGFPVENGRVDTGSGHRRQTEAQGGALDASHPEHPRKDKSKPFVPFNSLTYATDSSSESSPLFTWLPAADNNIREKIANSKLAGVIKSSLRKPVSVSSAAPSKTRPTDPPRTTSQAELSNIVRPDVFQQHLTNVRPAYPPSVTAHSSPAAPTHVHPPPNTSQSELSDRTHPDVPQQSLSTTGHAHPSPATTTQSSHQAVNTYTQTPLLYDSSTSTTTTTTPPIPIRTTNSSQEATKEVLPFTPSLDTPPVPYVRPNPPDASLASGSGVEGNSTRQSSLASNPSSLSVGPLQELVSPYLSTRVSMPTTLPSVPPSNLSPVLPFSSQLALFAPIFTRSSPKPTPTPPPSMPSPTIPSSEPPGSPPSPTPLSTPPVASIRPFPTASDRPSPVTSSPPPPPPSSQSVPPKLPTRPTPTPPPSPPPRPPATPASALPLTRPSPVTILTPSVPPIRLSPTPPPRPPSSPPTPFSSPTNPPSIPPFSFSSTPSPASLSRYPSRPAPVPPYTPPPPLTTTPSSTPLTTLFTRPLPPQTSFPLSTRSPSEIFPTSDTFGPALLQGTRPTTTPAPAITWFPPTLLFTLGSTTSPVSSAQGIVTWFPPYKLSNATNISSPAFSFGPVSSSTSSSSFIASTPSSLAASKVKPPLGPNSLGEVISTAERLSSTLRPATLSQSPLLTWRPSHQTIATSLVPTAASSGGLLVAFSPKPYTIVQEDVTSSLSTSSLKTTEKSKPVNAIQENITMPSLSSSSLKTPSPKLKPSNILPGSSMNSLSTSSLTMPPPRTFTIAPHINRNPTAAPSFWGTPANNPPATLFSSTSTPQKPAPQSSTVAPVFNRDSTRGPTIWNIPTNNPPATLSLTTSAPKKPPPQSSTIAPVVNRVPARDPSIWNSPANNLPATLFLSTSTPKKPTPQSFTISSVVNRDPTRVPSIWDSSTSYSPTVFFLSTSSPKEPSPQSFTITPFASRNYTRVPSIWDSSTSYPPTMFFSSTSSPKKPSPQSSTIASFVNREPALVPSIWDSPASNPPPPVTPSESPTTTKPSPASFVLIDSTILGGGKGTNEIRRPQQTPLTRPPARPSDRPSTLKSPSAPFMLLHSDVPGYGWGANGVGRPEIPPSLLPQASAPTRITISPADSQILQNFLKDMKEDEEEEEGDRLTGSLFTRRPNESQGPQGVLLTQTPGEGGGAGGGLQPDKQTIGSPIKSSPFSGLFSASPITPSVGIQTTTIIPVTTASTTTINTAPPLKSSYTSSILTNLPSASPSNPSTNATSSPTSTSASSFRITQTSVTPSATLSSTSPTRSTNTIPSSTSFSSSSITQQPPGTSIVTASSNRNETQIFKSPSGSSEEAHKGGMKEPMSYLFLDKYLATLVGGNDILEGYNDMQVAKAPIGSSEEAHNDGTKGEAPDLFFHESPAAVQDKSDIQTSIESSSSGHNSMQVSKKSPNDSSEDHMDGVKEGAPDLFLHGSPTTTEGAKVTTSSLKDGEVHNGEGEFDAPPVRLKVWVAEDGRLTLVSSGAAPSHTLASHSPVHLQSSPPPPSPTPPVSVHHQYFPPSSPLPPLSTLHPTTTDYNLSQPPSPPPLSTLHHPTSHYNESNSLMSRTPIHRQPSPPPPPPLISTLQQPLSFPIHTVHHSTNHFNQPSDSSNSEHPLLLPFPAVHHSTNHFNQSSDSSNTEHPLLLPLPAVHHSTSRVNHSLSGFSNSPYLQQLASFPLLPLFDYIAHSNHSHGSSSGFPHHQQSLSFPLMPPLFPEQYTPPPTHLPASSDTPHTQRPLASPFIPPLFPEQSPFPLSTQDRPPPDPLKEDSAGALTFDFLNLKEWLEVLKGEILTEDFQEHSQAHNRPSGLTEPQNKTLTQQIEGNPEHKELNLHLKEGSFYPYHLPSSQSFMFAGPSSTLGAHISSPELPPPSSQKEGSHEGFPHLPQFPSGQSFKIPSLLSRFGSPATPPKLSPSSSLSSAQDPEREVHNPQLHGGSPHLPQLPTGQAATFSSPISTLRPHPVPPSLSSLPNDPLNLYPNIYDYLNLLDYPPAPLDRPQGSRHPQLHSSLDQSPPTNTNFMGSESTDFGTLSLPYGTDFYGPHVLPADLGFPPAPSSTSQTKRPASVSPSIPGASFSDSGHIPPIADVLKHSLLLNDILQDLLRDDNTLVGQLGAISQANTSESFVDGDSTIGGQMETSLQRIKESSANGNQHLNSVTSSPSPKPEIDQTFINPLLPPLLPILFGQSFPSMNLTGSQREAEQAASSNTVLPAHLNSSYDPSPEVLKVLASLQYDLDSAPSTVQHHPSDIEEKTVYNLPPLFNKDFDAHGSLLPLWTSSTPPPEKEVTDLDWAASIWQNLLHPPYLETLLADLNTGDPHIKRILTTLMVSSLFAINPHLSHILHQHESLGVSHDDQGIQHPSLTTEGIKERPSSPALGEIQPVSGAGLLLETQSARGVAGAHFTQQDAVSTLMTSSFLSPQQSPVTQPSQLPEQRVNDALTTEPKITIPASNNPSYTSAMKPEIATPAGIDIGHSSESLSTSHEDGRVEMCLGKQWCIMGLALTLSLGTASAMMVPLVAPAMGRRRRKLTLTPGSFSNLHLPLSFPPAMTFTSASSSNLHIPVFFPPAERLNSGLRLSLPFAPTPSSGLHRPSSSLAKKLDAGLQQNPEASSGTARRFPSSDPEGKKLLNILHRLASCDPESKVMSSILHRLAAFDPEGYAAFFGGAPQGNGGDQGEAHTATP